MRADYRVFLDACVLANYGVCNLLLRLAERPRLFVPCWSEAVLAEVSRTQRQRLNWPEHLVESFQHELRRAFPQALVDGYEELLPAVSNHPKDRHVLAAAIRGQCPLILTFNLKDFKPEALTPWSIEACHPEEYLLILYEMEPTRVIACLGEIAGRRSMEVEDILIRLGKVMPRFSARILDDLGA